MAVVSQGFPYLPSVPHVIRPAFLLPSKLKKGTFQFY